MKALVCGAGGFIGSHLVKRLKAEGYYVIGVDRKVPIYWETVADEFYTFDLRKQSMWSALVTSHRNIDEIYQLAADMGGLGYIATGKNDLDIMLNSSLINLNCVGTVREMDMFNQGTIDGTVENDSGELFTLPKIFFSSSSCIYPRENQIDPNKIVINEESAYPAQCDNNYGWEKLFAERIYQVLHEDIPEVEIRIARFHNTFGPYETFRGNRAKAPGATCLKVASIEGIKGTVEVWGDGTATRTYMYIDDCIEGIRRLMNAPYFGSPLNLGSTESISADELAYIVAAIAQKEIRVVHKTNDPNKPEGVKARTSDNRRLRAHIGWEPSIPIAVGLRKMYEWMKGQLEYEKDYKEA